MAERKKRDLVSRREVAMDHASLTERSSTWWIIEGAIFGIQLTFGTADGGREAHRKKRLALASVPLLVAEHVQQILAAQFVAPVAQKLSGSTCNQGANHFHSARRLRESTRPEGSEPVNI
jgi:hypothetical protein